MKNTNLLSAIILFTTLGAATTQAMSPILTIAVGTALTSGVTIIWTHVHANDTVGKKQYLRALNEDAAVYLANPDIAPSALLAPVLVEAKRLTCEANECASDEQVAKEILAQSAE